MDWDTPMVRSIRLNNDPLNDVELNAASDVALEADNPYKIPDWRNPKAYPAADDPDILRWRWEFIRRHPTYRKAWQAYLVNFSAWSKKDERGFSKGEQIANRFGLRDFISPADKYDFRVWVDMIQACQVVFLDNYTAIKIAEEAINQGHCVTSIDPLGPLDSQLQLIKKRILAIRKHHKPENRWAKREHWQLYLRLLDAKDESRKILIKRGAKAKATNTDILSVINEEKLHITFFEEKEVETRFKQAEKLRDRFLFSSPHVA